MNYTKVISTIERIYENYPDENLCLFINGHWGIGKTFTIQKWGEENNEKFDFKYVNQFHNALL
ncbi:MULTISPECIES: P-loop NTPase fold protein [Paenibacillus]|uniref:P-loop NTPase fold protein n=1 Tax=Paenibacillus TaxID=44249 RepID=UPI0011A64DC7